MRHTFSRRRAAGLALVSGLAVAAGCQTDRSEKPGFNEPILGAPAAAPQPRERGPGAAAGQRLYFPTGQAGSSVIMMAVEAPAQVRVNQPYEYEVLVRNLTDTPLAGVVIRELPHDVSMGQDPSERDGGMPGQGDEMNGRGGNSWPLGTLAPRESRVVRVQGTAEQLGMTERCFAVEYSPAVCTVVAVVNPELRLTKTGPQQALICNPLSYRYVVRNVGTGEAENVRIIDELPPGLTTAQGGNVVEIDVGALPAGEERSYTVDLRATRTGEYSTRASALSEGGEAQAEPVTTLIAQPVLEVSVQAPEFEYLGQSINYQVVVTNRGDAPAFDTTLLLSGAPVENRRRALGTIGPGESRQVSIAVPGPGLQNRDVRQVRLEAAATAECAEQVAQAAVTEIRALSALLLEVVDTDDPVRVGDQTTYQIVVKNQGSGPASDVRIQAELPPGLEFVSATGDTQVRAEGQTIQFESIPNLPPGATANYRVVVRATQPGSEQFQLRMQGEGMDQPAIETEPTRLY